MRPGLPLPGRQSDTERRTQTSRDASAGASGPGRGPLYFNPRGPQVSTNTSQSAEGLLFEAKHNLLFYQRAFFNQFDGQNRGDNSEDVDRNLAQALHDTRTTTLEGKRDVRRWALEQQIADVMRQVQDPRQRLEVLRQQTTTLLSFEDNDGGDNMWVLLGFELFMAATDELEAEIAKLDRVESQRGCTRAVAAGPGRGGPQLAGLGRREPPATRAGQGRLQPVEPGRGGLYPVRSARRTPQAPGPRREGSQPVESGRGRSHPAGLGPGPGRREPQSAGTSRRESAPGVRWATGAPTERTAPGRGLPPKIPGRRYRSIGSAARERTVSESDFYHRNNSGDRNT